MDVLTVSGRIELFLDISEMETVLKHAHALFWIANDCTQCGLLVTPALLAFKLDISLGTGSGVF
jgi:hypothetical protein